MLPYVHVRESMCECVSDACGYDLCLYRLQCNGVCTDLPCPATYCWPRTWSFVCARTSFINMYFLCVCMRMYASMCVHLLHSRWRSFVSPPVEHLEGCQRDEWLPLYRLLLSAASSLSPSSVLHFSFPSPFHITSASFLYFSSISSLPTHLLFITFFCSLSLFVLSVLYFTESQTMSPYCVREWPLERADMNTVNGFFAIGGLAF